MRISGGSGANSHYSAWAQLEQTKLSLIEHAKQLVS